MLSPILGKRFSCLRPRALASIFHQGRARVGCDAVRWQGVTTLRARAREEEQRRQRTAAQVNRVCSAFNQELMGLVYRNLHVHNGFPAEESGQLPDLGSACIRQIHGLRREPLPNQGPATLSPLAQPQ